MRSKRRRLVISLVVAVMALVCSNACWIHQSGIAAQVLGGLGRAVLRAEGLQWLFSELNIDLNTPKDVALQWLERGAELEQNRQYEGALKAYERALELAPDEALVHLAMGSAYVGLEERDEARDHLEKAVELDPDNATVRRHLGRLLCVVGEYEACVSTLEKAVEIDPEDVVARTWLGLAYQQSGENGFNKALAAYQEVLEIDPDLAPAHLALGYLYESRPGREVLAIEHFKKALEAAVEGEEEELAAEARAKLADLYYARDSFSECIDELQQVLEDSPDDADAHRRLGICYALRGQAGDLDQGIEELETALADTFSEIDLYYLYLGDYYAADEDYTRAVWAWEQFLRFSDDEDMKAEVQDRIDQHTQ
jgi:tetratricopeptide (TPR) repeat protein